MRIIVFVLALFLFVSCRFGGGKPVAGNGRITTQQKEVGDFNSVDVSGQVVLKVSQGATPSLRIEADENLMEYIDVQTRGNTVVIKTKDGYQLEPTRSITVYVTAPVYRELDASGQCTIIGETAITGSDPLTIHTSGQVSVQLELNVPKLTTDISGQGALNLKGITTDFESNVSGNGSLKCFDLITENTSLDISGATTVEITANKKLSVDASGASNVSYKGTASVNQNVSGASRVTKVD